MAKTDLKDITFMIPLKIDTVDRVLNLIMVTEFLLDHFDTKIQILETGHFNNKLLSKLLSADIKYSFIEDFDPVYYRTYYINQMVKKCDTPNVAIWDSDVLALPAQITMAVNWLRNDEADFVYPYEFKFLDTSKDVRELYFKTRDFAVLERNRSKMKEMYAPKPVGGAFMARLDKYIKSGIENTRLYGWGVEDGERICRWTNLGYRVKRAEGALFHLTHDRGMNSYFTFEQGEEKKLELTRIFAMNKEEMENEIKTWKDFNQS